MACGLPAIACQGSGAAEVVISGQTGFLVPPGDAIALAEAIRSLLLDDSLRTKMSRAAREHVVRSAHSKHCLDQLEAFYRQVASSASGAHK
jgi:glycosyltransferase involved in cell wall biosynthesis